MGLHTFIRSRCDSIAQVAAVAVAAALPESQEAGVDKQAALAECTDPAEPVEAAEPELLAEHAEFPVELELKAQDAPIAASAEPPYEVQAPAAPPSGVWRLSQCSRAVIDLE